MLKANAILEGDFWPELVRVLTLRPVGSSTQIEAVGTKTQLFYSRILSAQDLARVRVARDAEWDFGGRGEAFFLAMEAHRIRYAHQFDVLFAVNVSQVDPLPHQIEAVYHCIVIGKWVVGEQ